MTAREPLSTKQAEAFEYVIRYLETHGYAPTLREVGEALGVSTSAAKNRLLSCAKKGYVRYHRRIQRSIVVCKSEVA